jgi:hypothetical protein
MIQDPADRETAGSSLRLRPAEFSFERPSKLLELRGEVLEDESFDAPGRIGE